MEKLLKNIEDPYQWSLETVEALRAGDFSRIDMDELINEIGAIASGLRREMVWVLTDMLEAMLLLSYESADAQEADKQLAAAQSQFQSLMDAAPSLRSILPATVAEAYGRARQNLMEDFRMTLPEACPLTIDQIVEDPFDRLLAEGKLA